MGVPAMTARGLRRLGGDGWLLALLAIGVAMRLPIWFAYESIPLGDTSDYLDVADAFRRLDFSGYDAHRPPLYPVMLALLGLQERAVWLVQAALGLVSSVLFYVLARSRTGRRGWAFVAALPGSLFLNLLFMETSVLTETLSRFLLALSLFLLLQGARRACSSRVYWAATGVATVLVGFSHPLFLFLLLPYGAFLFLAPLHDADGWRNRIGRSLAFGVPMVLAVAALSIFNQRVAGYLGPTSMTGFNLVNHSGAFIEHADERYAVIRDTYLPYRALGLDSTETGSQTIWRAQDELVAKTGWSFVEMSKELTAMSVDLFRRHPRLYLSHVLESWRAFWLLPIYWHVDRIEPAWFSRVLQAVWKVEKLVGVMLLLLLVPQVLFVTLSAWRGRLWRYWSEEIMLLSTVLLTSVLQALVDYGQNPRYLLVVFSILFYLPVVVALRRRNGAGGASS